MLGIDYRTRTQLLHLPVEATIKWSVVNMEQRNPLQGCSCSCGNSYSNSRAKPGTNTSNSKRSHR